MLNHREICHTIGEQLTDRVFNMRFPPWDPESELLRLERAAYCRKHGRFPSDEELRRDRDEEEQLSRERDREERERQAKRQQDKEIEDEKRRSVIARRIAAAETRPINYVPPASVEKLRERVKDGEAYFPDMRLNEDGMEDDVIDFDLEACNCSSGRFHRIVFAGANLSGASFSNSKFVKIRFAATTTCKSVDFHGSVFQDTQFERSCTVTGSDFRDANFDGKSSIEFDRNSILHARFSRTNSYQQLTAAYTPARQFLNVSLGLGYVGLMVGKVYFLSAVAAAQSTLMSKALVRDAFDFDSMEREGRTIASIIVQGMSPSIVTAGLFILVLLYQVGRWHVTTIVGPMIEYQRSDGRTPNKDSYEGAIKFQRIVKWLGWAAFGVFLDLACSGRGTTEGFNLLDAVLRHVARSPH